MIWWFVKSVGNMFDKSCRITLNDISCKTCCVLLYLIVYSIDSVKFLWHKNVFYNSDVRIVGWIGNTFSWLNFYVNFLNKTFSFEACIIWNCTLANIWCLYTSKYEKFFCITSFPRRRCLLWIKCVQINSYKY